MRQQQVARQPGSASLQSVDSLGNLTVGQPLPGYSGVSKSGQSVGPNIPSGQFFIHYAAHDYPDPLCLDAECGPIGENVQALGGHLIAGSDGKFADAGFGVMPPPGEPLEWRVAVVSDGDGKILAIYDDVAIADLPAMVEAWSNKPGFDSN